MDNKTYEPAPAGTLDTGSGGVEFLLEVVEGAESLSDGLLERTVGEDTTVALTLGLGTSKVLPEERMVDVSCISSRGEQGSKERQSLDVEASVRPMTWDIEPRRTR